MDDYVVHGGHMMGKTHYMLTLLMENFTRWKTRAQRRRAIIRRYAEEIRRLRDQVMRLEGEREVYEGVFAAACTWVRARQRCDECRYDADTAEKYLEAGDFLENEVNCILSTEAPHD